MRDERCGRASVLAQSCTHEEAEVCGPRHSQACIFPGCLLLKGTSISSYRSISHQRSIRSRDHTAPYWFHALKMPTVQSSFPPAAFELKVAALSASSKCQLCGVDFKKSKEKQSLLWQWADTRIGRASMSVRKATTGFPLPIFPMTPVVAIGYSC